MRLLMVAAVVCLSLGALVGCGSDSESESRYRTDTHQPRAAASGQRAPRSCPTTFVESRVQNFLAAANSGRAARIERAVAGGPGLIFSHGLEYGRQQPRRFFSTADRDELVRHLLKRQRLGDRMGLLRIWVSGFDRRLGICNFGFEILRRIGGGPPRAFIGKGAIYQDSGHLVVWNTGGGGKV